MRLVVAIFVIGLLIFVPKSNGHSLVNTIPQAIQDSEMFELTVLNEGKTPLAFGRTTHIYPASSVFPFPIALEPWELGSQIVLEPGQSFSKAFKPGIYNFTLANDFVVRIDLTRPVIVKYPSMQIEYGTTEDNVKISGITLQNYSHLEICYIMISPETNPSWGNDQLDRAEVLKSTNSIDPEEAIANGTGTIRFWNYPSGNYDILLAGCDQSYLGSASIVVDGNTPIVFPDDFFQIDNLRQATLKIHNTSPYDICEVRFDPRMSFGSLMPINVDPLATFRVFAGDTLDATVLSGYYDIVFVDCEGNSQGKLRGFDLKNNQEIDFSGQDTLVDFVLNDQELEANPLVLLRAGMESAINGQYGMAQRYYNFALYNTLPIEDAEPSYFFRDDLWEFGNLGDPFISIEIMTQAANAYQEAGDLTSALGMYQRALVNAQRKIDIILYENETFLSDFQRNIEIESFRDPAYQGLLDSIDKFTGFFISDTFRSIPSDTEYDVLAGIFGEDQFSSSVYASEYAYFYGRYAQALVGLGRLYSRLGLTRDAQSYLKRAFFLGIYGVSSDTLGVEADETKAVIGCEQLPASLQDDDPVYWVAIADAFVGLAENYASQGRFERVSDCYDRAAEVDGDRDWSLARAKLALAQGDLLRATEILSTYQQDELSLVQYAHVLNTIAYAQSDIQTFSQAIDLWQQTENVLDRASALLGRARLQSDPEAAIADYTEGLSLLERYSGDIQAGSISSASSAIQRLDYDRLAFLLIQQGRVNEALDIVERGRGRHTWLEIQNGDQPRVGINAGDKRLALRQAVIMKLLAGGSKTVVDTDNSTGEIIEFDADTLQSEYLRLNDIIAAQNTAPDAAQFATIETIQSQLPAETAMIYYVLSDIGSAAIILTKSTSTSVSLDVDYSDLLNKIEIYKTDRRNTQQEFLSYLYDRLITPLGDIPENLLIVPDVHLNYVPFSALHSTEGNYVVDDHTVAIVPSAAVYFSLITRVTEPPTEQPVVMVSLSSPPSVELPDLVYAQQEAEAVARELGLLQTLQPATEENLEESVKGTGIVHIAAHAMMNSNVPLFSAIYLEADFRPTVDGYIDPASDGILNAIEVYSLDLAATKLVVLSGCDTASGGDGEDLGTLTRAFLTAGTQEVTASLWSVDDEITTQLITSFYENMKAGLDTPHALQRAMKSIKDEVNDDPYLWASFTVFGVPAGQITELPIVISDEPATPLPTQEGSQISTDNAVTEPSMGVTRPTSYDAARQFPSLWSNTEFIDMQTPGTQNYTVSVDADMSYRFSFTWCADTGARLREILAPLTLTFYISDIEIQPSQLLQTDRGSCRIWDTIFSRWSTEEPVEIEIRYTLAEQIYDGNTYYEAGIYTHRMTVNAG